MFSSDIFAFPISDATSINLKYSKGCSVLEEKEVIYFCPGKAEILSFKCEIKNGLILRWEVTPSIQIDISSIFTNDDVISEGNVTAIVQNVELGSFNSNYTSLLFMDTTDLLTETEVKCGDIMTKTITLRPLGKYFISKSQLCLK